MSNIENVTSDLGQALRMLRDDEVGAVSGGCACGQMDGGFIIDWRTEAAAYYPRVGDRS